MSIASSISPPGDRNKYPCERFTILATYPVINTETGEQKEVQVSILDWDAWKNENPDWIRDWSDPETCPGMAEIGEWKDKLNKNHPGWKEVMKKVEKAPGARAKNLY